MSLLYLIVLLVGGFFVILSIVGGGEANADVEVEYDLDYEPEAGHAEAASGSGPGFVDLISVRTLFLFAAFFGLTGTALSLLDVDALLTALCATGVGLLVGFGGNYAIKRVGYAHVSSLMSARDVRGLTARVLVPFEGAQKGKISLVARGHRLDLVATAFEQLDAFFPGDEVVIVRMEGAVAEVVKPD